MFKTNKDKIDFLSKINYLTEDDIKQPKKLSIESLRKISPTLNEFKDRKSTRLNSSH